MSSQVLKSTLLASVFALGAATSAQAIPVGATSSAQAGSVGPNVDAQSGNSAGGVYSGASASVGSASTPPDGWDYYSCGYGGCEDTDYAYKYQNYYNTPEDGGYRDSYWSRDYDGANSYTNAYDTFSGVNFFSRSYGNTDYIESTTNHYGYDPDYGGGYGGEYGGEYGGGYGGYTYSTEYELGAAATPIETFSYQELVKSATNTSLTPSAYVLNFLVPNVFVYLDSSYNNCEGSCESLATSLEPPAIPAGPGALPVPTTMDSDGDTITDDLDPDDDNDGLADEIDEDRNGDDVYDFDAAFGSPIDGSSGVNAELWLNSDSGSTRLWGFTAIISALNGQHYWSHADLEPGSGIGGPSFYCSTGPEYCSASNFAGSLNLGAFDPGESFSVSYIVRTWVNAVGGSNPSLGHFDGGAGFGDPFDFGQPLVDVRVADGVPAPAALGMLGLGLFGFGALRRRRSKK